MMTETFKQSVFPAGFQEMAEGRFPTEKRGKTPVFLSF